jgi:hypothetical protein
MHVPVKVKMLALAIWLLLTAVLLLVVGARSVRTLLFAVVAPILHLFGRTMMPPTGAQPPLFNHPPPFHGLYRR